MFGTGVAAIVPMPSVVGASVAAVDKGKYLWAVAIANAQNAVSPSVLESTLGVPAAQAQALCGRLIERGVITAPNAAGISRAVSPMFRGAGGAAVQATTANSPTGLNKIAKQVTRLADNDFDADLNGPISPLGDDSVQQEALDEEHSAE